MIREKLNQLYESCKRREYCGTDLYGNKLYCKVRCTTTPEGVPFIDAVNEIAKDEGINLNCTREIVDCGDFNIIVVAVAWCQESMIPEQLIFTFPES